MRRWTETKDFNPMARDHDSLARHWVVPGTPGLTHRIGGIEKSYETGNICYEADNHQKMTNLRREKIANIPNDIPLQEVTHGEAGGRMAVVGWGSTFGPIDLACEKLRADGLDVSHIHLRHIWPLPLNLGELLRSFEIILVPEMNTGQLVNLLRAEYLVPAEGLNQVTGQPFKVTEVEAAVRARLEQ